MKSIALIFTGGTISMKRGSDGAIPALGSGELLSDWAPDQLPFEFEAIDFGRYPGPHMHAGRVLELHRVLEEALEQHDAAVITHGTDSLEETAFQLGLWHRGPEPVVLTGAMRTSGDPDFDGNLNLRHACLVAVEEEARERGVLVLMNRQIHSANEVTKVSTDAMNPLASGPAGPLGQVDDGHICWLRGDSLRLGLAPPEAPDSDLPWVELLTAHPDSGARAVDSWLAAGCRGLVVRAMGRGNVAPDTARALIHAAESIPVVLVSRCPGGQPGCDYGYPGGGAELVGEGLILCQDLNDLKARAALARLLQAGASRERIRSFLERATAGP